jgi:hypothetical protein
MDLTILKDTHVFMAFEGARVLVHAKEAIDTTDSYVCENVEALLAGSY